MYFYHLKNLEKYWFYWKFYFKTTEHYHALLIHYQKNFIHFVEYHALSIHYQKIFCPKKIDSYINYIKNSFYKNFSFVIWYKNKITISARFNLFFFCYLLIKVFALCRKLYYLWVFHVFQLQLSFRELQSLYKNCCLIY